MKEIHSEKAKETGLSFSEALVHMKNGERVRRAGWNGKGMWIGLVEPHVPYVVAKIQQLYPGVEISGATPYFIMYAADKTIVTGWLASQTDMVSEDWELVKEN